MPTFDFKCEKCGAIREVFDTTADAIHECWYCGGDASVFWTKAPGMSPDPFWAGATHPSLGYFTSREQMQAKMEARGLMPYEPGRQGEIKRNFESRYEKETRPIRDGLHAEVDKMTPEECARELKAFESSQFVMHPTHSPAGVKVEASHIERITGAKVTD